MRTGLLRNLVLAGSRTDKEVDITSITHQVILPIINQLLELKVESVVRQVTELVAQVVSVTFCSEQGR